MDYAQIEAPQYPIPDQDRILTVKVVQRSHGQVWYQFHEVNGWYNGRIVKPVHREDFLPSTIRNLTIAEGMGL